MVSHIFGKTGQGKRIDCFSGGEGGGGLLLLKGAADFFLTSCDPLA